MSSYDSYRLVFHNSAAGPCRRLTGVSGTSPGASSCGARLVPDGGAWPRFAGSGEAFDPAAWAWGPVQEGVPEDVWRRARVGREKDVHGPRRTRRGAATSVHTLSN